MINLRPAESCCFRLPRKLVRSVASSPHGTETHSKRMEQTGHWNESETLDLPALKQLLKERLAEVDFEQAKFDVRPFIRDDAELALWSPEFFHSFVDRVEADG